MRAFKIPLEKVRSIAIAHGYNEIDYQENIAMISFSTGDVRINIYLTRMTVGTCLTHPNKGTTQLFRKNVDEETLKSIFKNPRQHTGKGYYKRR